MFPQKILTFHSWDLYIENSSVLSRFGLHDPKSHLIQSIEVRECSETAWLQGSEPDSVPNHLGEDKSKRNFAEPLRANENFFGNSFRTMHGSRHLKNIAFSLKLAMTFALVFENLYFINTVTGKR
jgi:hypothetical protein